MKKHWVSLLLVFIGYSVGIIADSIIKPYLYKEIIDVMSSGLPKEIIFSKVLGLAYILCIVIAIYLIGYRTGDFSNAYMESKVMKRLYDFSFEF